VAEYAEVTEERTPMPEYEHKTERGALLAELEHRCIRSGEWEVEGHSVTRVRSISGGNPFWLTQGRGTAREHVDFTAALRYIADFRTH
jgi:hypothetical protein